MKDLAFYTIMFVLLAVQVVRIASLIRELQASKRALKEQQARWAAQDALFAEREAALGLYTDQDNQNPVFGPRSSC